MPMITLHIAAASLTGLLLFAMWKKWQGLNLKRISFTSRAEHPYHAARDAEIRAWMQNNGHR